MKKEWVKLKTGEKINVINKLSKIIIEELSHHNHDFFLLESRPERTRFIKDKLAILGHKLGYKVYTNNLSPELCQSNGGCFKNCELLFDFQWYIEGTDNYTTICIPLTMECEWQQKRKGDSKVPFSGIKYDFQKLLVSNAEIRMMIFKIKYFSDLEALSEYFSDNIKNYKHLPKGSKFLFVGFYDKEEIFYYKEIYKS